MSGRVPDLFTFPHNPERTLGVWPRIQPVVIQASENPIMDAPHVNPQKQRRGLQRLVHAAGYSLQGLRSAWHETAFRQEFVLFWVLLPIGCWLATSWVEGALLLGSLMLVLIVELLNTGIESAIDRIGPEWHELSKRAKDMGSAAVLLSLLLCLGIWGAALWRNVLS
jgi:diacylglycerol kinase (ATP)